MALLTVANLTHTQGDKRVLDGASLSIDAGQRIGLVGRNGCGKTTLMRLMCGTITPDDGQVQLTRGMRAGYLAQDPQLDATRTLRAEAEQAFAALAQLHEQLQTVAHDMATAEGEPLDRLMKRYEQLEHEMQAAGGYAIDHRIDATLHGLGLGDETFNVPVSGLSGGQKARLALTKLLLSEPDVLLLDEPTNHLDIVGRQWLEQFLNAYPGAMLIVSHDRWLLDQVVHRIVELERGKIFDYPGNYAAFRQLRAGRRLEQQRVYDKQQTHIRHQKQFIDRYRAGQRAKQAQGRQSQLDRYIRDQAVAPLLDEKELNLQLPPVARSGDIVLTASGISAGYEGKPLFAGFDLVIKRGQRIGVIGPNGCGKSTLVRSLIGLRDPDSGAVRLGSNLSVGYYHQTHEHLESEDTPVTYLQRHVERLNEQSARDLAGAFLFSGQEQDKPLGVLSGGERTRVVLAALVAGGHNLLVLDEPSNHLDILSAERLEAALRQYEGTLILITHDRMLLQDTVDELLIFESGTVRHFIGSYREWLDAQSAVTAKPTPAPAAPKPVPKSKPKPKPKSVKRPFGALADADLEKRIMTLEAGLAELDQQLADPRLYRDKDRFQTVQGERRKLAAQREPLEAEWLFRAESR